METLPIYSFSGLTLIAVLEVSMHESGADVVEWAGLVAAHFLRHPLPSPPPLSLSGTNNRFECDYLRTYKWK